ncbi:MAG: aminotransferase class I/II-fold pyridoxal phosphate-dependent enzyme [Candidatus Firestonebacteria bacterium]
MKTEKNIKETRVKSFKRRSKAMSNAVMKKFREQMPEISKFKDRMKNIYQTSKLKMKLKARKYARISEEHVISTGTKHGDLFEKARNFTAANEVRAAGLYPYFRALESGQDTEVMYHNKKLIMIGSNNYLGLTSHPKVKEAVIEAVKKYGSGCSGSRFLNGTLDLHVELENRLAKFMNKETVLVFSTGFTTNLGVISYIAGKDDVILCDRTNHASIIDGCRLSFAKTMKFKHNDMEDLERLISKIDPKAGKLIVVDGVFSMEGDLVNLPGIVKIAQKHGARVMVDDAHSLGVFGKNGRGTAEHFGLEDKVDMIMGTFSKSFASLGGFIASEAPVIDYLKLSREQIFQASCPPANVAAVLAALDIIEAEPERREHLWKITRKMLQGYKDLGFKIGNSESPIIPIFVGDDYKCFKMSKMLEDEGVFVNPIVSPAVPPGQALIRTSYTATHTEKEMDFVLEKFKKVGKELGII